MNVIRLPESNYLRPLHVFMLALLVVAVAGGLWLLSAAESTTLPDGAIEWHQESLLRAVVTILCLNYQFPTLYAGDVKVYILSLACGLSLLAMSVSLIAGKQDSPTTASSLENCQPDQSSQSPKKHISPLAAAQLLGAMFVLWSFCSSRWSAAPDWALGGSLLIAIPFFWSLVLGNALNKYAARIACGIVIILGAITACIAIWYYYGRKPDLRAEFTVGNPIFQATCLIAPILLAIGWFMAHWGQRKTISRGRWVAGIPGSLVALVLCGIAFVLCDSRGPMIGLGAGALAMIFFSLPKRKRWIPIVLACVLIVIVGLRVSQQLDMATGSSRAATVRFRLYAWDYAWRLFTQKPLQGHGQGGFTLQGDSFASEDVLSDPIAFDHRIAHAHNEWLEILSDLGIVGGLLMAAFIVMTIRAGMIAMRDSQRVEHRWLVAALLGVFVGMIVEETFGVGLRVSAVSTMFYSVVGLIWALSHGDKPPLITYLAAPRWRQLAATGFAGAIGLLVLILAQADFASARWAYKVEEALAQGDFDEAVRFTEFSNNRLNPQRALTNLLRVSRTHMLSANFYQNRAFDRGNRAIQDGVKNNALLTLADQDITLSEQHLVLSTQALKLLIERAPGYFNHGRIEYALYRIRADRAAALGDHSAHDLAMTNAAAALKREIKRQPYDHNLILDYLHIAWPSLSLHDMALTLAPSLHTNRISPDDIAVIEAKLNTPEGEAEWLDLQHQAQASLHQPDGITKDPKLARWAWEVLRIHAAVTFMRGDYAGAQRILEGVTTAYTKRSSTPSDAMAIGYAELAQCRFLNHPNKPEQALDSVQKALQILEGTHLFNDLRDSIRMQMIDYQLAAGNEAAPRAWLTNLAPNNVTNDQIDTLIGTRYRRLCQMLLNRRQPHVLRQSVNDIIPNMMVWSRRAIELDPNDAQAYPVAADLSFYAGTCEPTASYMREAIKYGISPESALQFLTMAAKAKPACKTVAALRDEINEAINHAQQSQQAIPQPLPTD